MAVDTRSENNIRTLNPKVQPLARELIEKAVAAGVHVKVISGTRTYAEQNELYAQGRTKPGMIVTKAKGGQSIHNFGCAWDVGIFSADGKIYFGESKDYAKVGAIGRGLGIEWGGDWTGFKDEPHFQVTNGRNLAQLREAFEKTGDALA
jgi:peptidoglycan LD-endopeptidase CwlK